jgi:diguanylate cyclase (GGDEF)-like protein
VSEQKQKQAWPASEQTRLLFNAGPVTIGTSISVAVLLVILHWAFLPHEPLLLWLILGLLISVLRAGMLAAYRIAPQRRSDQAWQRLFLLGVLLSGVLWGVAGAVVFPQQTISHAAFMAFALAGLCAGTVAVYTMAPMAFLAFALPTMVPFVLRLAMHPETEFKSMAGMSAIFVLALYLISRRSYHALSDVLSLRSENAVLHHRASHDSLVNLLNHGAFRQSLDEVVRVARQASAGIGLIFVDLDAFKRVNDTAGHMVGDELLQLIGARLADACSESGLAARMGGDEFAVLVYPADPGTTRIVAEQIRAAVGECTVARNGAVHRVGASVGAAFGWGDTLTATGLLEAADRACYLAKNSGRDKVEMRVMDPQSTREHFPRRSNLG